MVRSIPSAVNAAMVLADTSAPVASARTSTGHPPSPWRMRMRLSVSPSRTHRREGTVCSGGGIYDRGYLSNKQCTIVYYVSYVRPWVCASTSLCLCMSRHNTHTQQDRAGRTGDRHNTDTQEGRKEGEKRSSTTRQHTTHTDLSTLHYTTLCPYILRHRSRLHDTLLILRVHCTLSTRSCLGSEGRGQEDTITHFSNFQTTTPYQACLQAHI